MKTIYLHVGYHRTATTAIQLFLDHSTDWLNQRGYYYPKFGRSKAFKTGHHLFAWSFIENENNIPYFATDELHSSAEDLWGNLIREIEETRYQNIVLSSEEFDVFSRAELEKLSILLKNYKIVPIVVVRNLPTMLESFYKISVLKFNERRDFNTFIDHQRTRIDIAHFIKDLNDSFGEGSAKIVEYDNHSYSTSSIIQKFLNTIDIKSELDLSGKKIVNSSAPAYICEIVRFMRCKGVDDTTINNWCTKITKIISECDSEFNYSFFSKEKLKEIIEKYNSDIESMKIHSTHLKILVISDFNTLFTISNIVEAIFALTNELHLKEIKKVL